jgi:hypothetical protein
VGVRESAALTRGRLSLREYYGTKILPFRLGDRALVCHAKEWSFALRGTNTPRQDVPIGVVLV